MRRQPALLICTAITLATASPTHAGIMDESDCIHGPIHYGSAMNALQDLSNQVQETDKRLVACVNFLQEKLIDQSIRYNDRINELELRILTLEGSLRRLQK